MTTTTFSVAACERVSECSGEAIAAMGTEPMADGVMTIGRLATGGNQATLRTSRAVSGDGDNLRRGSV